MCLSCQKPLQGCYMHTCTRTLFHPDGILQEVTQITLWCTFHCDKPECRQYAESKRVEMSVACTDIGELTMVFETCRTCDQYSENVRKCQPCKLAYYCSRACQKADWPMHKLDCEPFSIAVKTLKAYGRVGWTSQWLALVLMINATVMMQACTAYPDMQYWLVW